MKNVSTHFMLALGLMLASLLNEPAIAAGLSQHPLTPSTPSVSQNLLVSGGTNGQLSPEITLTPALLHDGNVLYDEHCSSCHGAALEGTPGVPNLLHTGATTVDFYMTTGRMPAAVRSGNIDPHASTDAQMASGVQMDHERSAFTIHQIAALDAYVSSRATQSQVIYRPDAPHGNLQHGRQIFESNCQACHGASAQGATVGTQWTALALDGATNTQIAEAIRIGPGVMPHFTPAQISDRDIDDITKYLNYLRDTPQTFGGATLDTLGPVAEGAIGAFFGVGSLFVIIYWIGIRAQKRRAIDAVLSQKGIDEHQQP